MIRYIIESEQQLGAKLSENVHDLITRTFIAANTRTDQEDKLEHLVYDEEAQNMFLFEHYRATLDTITPKISVFAYDDDKLIGTGFFAANSQKGDLYGMYVDPKYQKQKIGTTIFGIILYNAGLKGIKTIHALATDFEWVLTFYKKLGFEKKGEVKMSDGKVELKMHDIELYLQNFK